VFLLDNYVGISTLDCLRDVHHPIRIMTGQQKQSVENGFDAAVKDFRAEGRTIEVRRHAKLHDRYAYGFYRCQNLKCKAVHVRKTDLERGFGKFLEQMQPKPEYLKLFSAIVLDVWKEKQAQNITLTASLKHHLEDLNQRKERLEEVFIEEQAIDRETYQRRHDKLDEQIMLVEMEERDAKLESYDVDGVLAFAEHVILNAARLWSEFSSDQKQQLQKVLFPQGVSFADGIYKTTETCLIFNLLQESEGEKTSLATLPGIETSLKFPKKPRLPMNPTVSERLPQDT